MTLKEFNKLPDSEAFDAFEQCCASSTWVIKMLNERPFTTEEKLYNKALFFFLESSFEDWLEACDGHPKIGDISSLNKKYAGTKQTASNEQSGVNDATADIIKQLAKGNEAYEAKFGYIFIVCATGKTAAEMVALLEKRLQNNEDEELKIAMNEQIKITKLRLQKLLEK